MAIEGLRVFGSTFLTFADYLKPALRMTCQMNLPIIYVFTHDSVGIGQDGPTHEPVEQLNNLRTIINLKTYRPCDGNEVIGSFLCSEFIFFWWINSKQELHRKKEQS